MSKSAPQAGSHVTRHVSFSQFNFGAEMFAVQQGVPAVYALQQASALLESCIATADAAAEAASESGDESRSFATIFMLQSVRALVNSVVAGMGDAK